MTRRLLLAACALGAGLALGSCATFDAAHIAEVNGAELDDEELEDMIDNDFARTELQTFVEDGVATGADARGLVQAWIVLTTVDQAGIVDDATKETVRAQLAEEFGEAWNGASPVLQEMFVINRAASDLNTRGQLDPTAIEAAIAAADVDLSSRIGYWNPETQSVDPLGAPAGQT